MNFSPGRSRRPKALAIKLDRAIRQKGNLKQTKEGSTTLNDHQRPAARVERLVVCVLLRHHDLVPEAMAAAHDGATPEPLVKLWHAARKVRRWIVDQLPLYDDEPAPADAAEASSTDRRDSTDADEAADEAPPVARVVSRTEALAVERQVCAPLEKRLRFLLDAMAPACRESGGAVGGGGGGRERGASVGGVVEGAARARALSGTSLPPSRGVSGEAAAAAAAFGGTAAYRSLSAQSDGGEDTFKGAPRLAKQNSWQRAVAKAQLAGGGAEDKWQGALLLARSLEKRARRLRRIGSHSGRIPTFLLGNSVVKYGQLTAEVLDFLDPRIRDGDARDAPPPLSKLSAEVERRAAAVAAATTALRALATALGSSRGWLRLPALSELARRSVMMRPPPTALHGAGRAAEREFTTALQSLFSRLVALLRGGSRRPSDTAPPSPFVSAATMHGGGYDERRLALQALLVPFAPDDVDWLRESQLLPAVQAAARARPDGPARRTLRWLLFDVVDGAAQPAAPASSVVPLRREPSESPAQTEWALGVLVSELERAADAPATEPPAHVLRLLQILAFTLPDAPREAAPPTVARLASPALLALARRLPPGGDASTLALRLLGRTLGGAAQVGATVDELLAKIGASLWRAAAAAPADGDGAPEDGAPAAADSGDATAAPSAGGSGGGALAWGAPPRDLHLRRVKALVVRVPPQPQSPRNVSIELPAAVVDAGVAKVSALKMGGDGEPILPSVKFNPGTGGFGASPSDSADGGDGDGAGGVGDGGGTRSLSVSLPEPPPSQSADGEAAVYVELSRAVPLWVAWERAADPKAAAAGAAKWCSKFGTSGSLSAGGRGSRLAAS